MKAEFLDVADPTVRARWADLVARAPQASPFATLAFAEAVAAVFGIGFRLAGVIAEDRLVGGVLLFERRRGPYRLVVVPPLAVYTSFLFDPPLRETDLHTQRSPLDALLALLDGHYHGLCFHLHPALADVRGFVWAGYRARPFYTYRRALVPREHLLREVSRGVRRRFEREGPAFEIQEAEGLAGALAGLAAESYARHDAASLPPDRRRAFLERLVAAGQARLVAAAPPGAPPEAAQALLTHGRTAYALTAGSRPGAAMSVLLVEILLRLHAEGFEALDLVGANTPSIAEFKRSFGPCLVPYFRVERFVRPELALLHALRPIF